MSTRATIKITEGDTARWLYHHSDGYPDWLGLELDDTLKTESAWTLPSIFTRLTEDEQYEPTGGIHGDEEYAYLIDCDNRTLKGYAIYESGSGASSEWTNEVMHRDYSAAAAQPKTFALADCFICEHCRKTCAGNCFEQLSKIQSGEWKPGDKDYEDNKDLIGRKQIIKCLGPYCDRPCGLQMDKFTPYDENDGVRPLTDAIKYLGSKVNELLAELNK